MTDETKINIRARLHRFKLWLTETGVIPRWQLLLVYFIIVTAMAIGLARTVSVTNDVKVVAARAEGLARSIQTQRITTVREGCEQQNVRHAQALKALNALIPPNQSAKRRAQSKKVVKALADAVAPKRDCDKVVDAATSP